MTLDKGGKLSKYGDYTQEKLDKVSWKYNPHNYAVVITDNNLHYKTTTTIYFENFKIDEVQKNAAEIKKYLYKEGDEFGITNSLLYKG